MKNKELTGETSMVQVEVDAAAKIMKLGQAAKGTIEPDGRDETENSSNQPCAAGGTNSLFVADALTTERYRIPATADLDQYLDDFCGALALNNIPIGGHKDNHNHENGSVGCGACDNANKIMAVMSQNADHIKNACESLGIKISSQQHQQIIKKADAFASQKFFENGEKLVGTYDKYGQVTMLGGDHKEVVLVINRQPNTTINRPKIEAELGRDMQAFNLDIWALENGVRKISLSEEEAQLKLIAALYYNMATVYTLAGPSLRVVQR